MRWSRRLEIAAVVCAVGALAYRSTVYWMLPPEPGEPYGFGDILDFVLALVVFAVCGLAAASAVLLSMTGEGRAPHLAFRPAVIGITAFVAYYFLYPYAPRLVGA